MRPCQKTVAAGRIDNVGGGNLRPAVIAVELQGPAICRAQTFGHGVLLLQHDARFSGMTKQDLVEVRAPYLIGKRQYRLQ